MSYHVRAGTEPESELMVDINTTPLVDVLLVLLVMLIITIPIQLHAVNLEMPGQRAPLPAVLPEVVLLDVSPAGFAWNGEALADRTALEMRLATAAAAPTPPEIHVRPQPGTRYEAVAQALSSAQRLGHVKIGLVGSTPAR